MSSELVIPKILNKQCLDIMAKYLECHNPLEFTIIDENREIFVLRNNDNWLSLQDSPNFYLCKVTNSKGLYVHLCLTYKSPAPNADVNKTKFRIQGISLQFFYGKGRLFCRAEWDIKEKKDKLIHPQPHWHWGGFKIDDTANGKDFINVISQSELQDETNIFLESIGKSNNTEKDMLLPNINMKELHYAISSKWTKENTAVEDFTIQKMTTWLEYCLVNVVDQYNYQVNKKNFVSIAHYRGLK